MNSGDLFVKKLIFFFEMYLIYFEHLFSDFLSLQNWNNNNFYIIDCLFQQL